MAIRHISKAGTLNHPDDLWRMSYCGTSVRVTKCISLTMYMKGFFEKVMYRPGAIDKLYPCPKCIENLDGVDMLSKLP